MQQTTATQLCTPHCDEVSHELSHGKEDHLAGREMAPLIPGWVVLEHTPIVLNMLSVSSSYVDLLPHHNSLGPGHLHWRINTPLPLQLGLGGVTVIGTYTIFS